MYQSVPTLYICIASLTNTNGTILQEEIMLMEYMEGFSQPQDFFPAGRLSADFRALCTGVSVSLLETIFVVP